MNAGAMAGMQAGMQGITAIGNAYAQSQAIKARAAYQSVIAKINAEMATMNAEDAIRRGEITARDYQKEVDGMIGMQKVAYASQNVDVNFGSAADIQAETRMFGALDALTIKNNAWREAWGYKVEALNSTFSGKYAEMEGKYGARQALLTGGMQALGYGASAIGSMYKSQAPTSIYDTNKASVATTGASYADYSNRA